MEHETPQAEVMRLLREQNQMRQDEVFGGLSLLERADYNRKNLRINELEIELQAEAIAHGATTEDIVSGKHRTIHWKKKPETDAPQDDARQPYRSREISSSRLTGRASRKKNTGDTDEIGE